MELSEHRHILYFSEQPIVLMEELLNIKKISFTHIPTGIPETALAQAQQHYTALMLLVNPLRRDYFPAMISVIEASEEESMFLQIKAKLENLV